MVVCVAGAPTFRELIRAESEKRRGERRKRERELRGKKEENRGEEEEEDRGEEDEAEEEHRGEGMIQEEAPSPLSSPSSSPSSPPPLTETEGVVFRTEHDQTALLSVAPDDHGEEEKKSPWQKREERPLLAVFNLK